MRYEIGGLDSLKEFIDEMDDGDRISLTLLDDEKTLIKYETKFLFRVYKDKLIFISFHTNQK